MSTIKFYKYHGLGNVYIVVDSTELGREITTDEVIRICDWHYGMGSDGIVFGPLPSDQCDFRLRIINPDGSEAEKSGNGLRIFSRYLFDKKLIDLEPFTLETLGGVVTGIVHDEQGSLLSIEMGKVRFTHSKEGAPAIQSKTLEVEGEIIEYYEANVGNPHCVIVCDELNVERVKTLGPLIENDPRFANRTNVQFLKSIDVDTIQIEIWERGAGYTLASGSSSTACAAVAYALGLCSSHVVVNMPGGCLEISFNEDFMATMKGPVERIGWGEFEF